MKTLLISFICLISFFDFSQCINVALNKPATSSSNYNSTAAGAFDGNCTTVWNSGGYSGYIQVDLQGTYTINNINLLVNQNPNGNTVHEIYKAASITGPWTLVETLSGSTSTGQMLQRCYSAAPLTNVGAIKINTVSTPSWISWYEIGVFTNSTSSGSITASGPLTFCSGGSVTLTASPGTSYLWSNGATTQSITVNSSGTYNVTINGTGSASCVNGNQTCTNCTSNTASKTVTVLPNPSVTIQSSINNPICIGDNVTLTAQGATSYSWNTGSSSTSINVSPVINTLYSVTGTGTGGCVGNASINLITPDTITWTGAADNDWHKPCNWIPEFVPECCNSVKIPFTPNSPVVSGIGKAKNVTLYSTSGATLTVNTGANLQIETCPVIKTQNSCPTLPVLTTTIISSATQTSAVSGGNITYTGASSITARGVCWSTTTAPTTANSKTTDGSGIGSFTSNLISLTAGTTYYVRAYATNASGTSYGNEMSFISQPAYAVGSIFCNGTPTYVQDVTNPITGKTWMDRNLGASQVATSSTDINAYGDLYQWGRRSDGHQCRTSTTTSTLSSIDQPANGNFIKAPNSPWDWRSPQNTNLWQGVNGINNPCPSGYRLPTELELDAERISWSSTNSLGAHSSPLKFTIGGRREFNTASFINVGITGYYWTSDYLGIYSKYLEFNSGGGNMNNFSRALSFSVRCIKN